MRVRPRWWLALVVFAATAFTLAISVGSVVSFAYSSASLHVAIETTAALVSLLTAQLVYGRFRRSLERSDLVLTAALVLFASVNLLFSTVPAIAYRDPGSFATWAPTLGGALATALFVAAAFTAPRPVHRPDLAVRRLAACCGAALLTIAIGTVLAEHGLPSAIEPSLSPDAASRPRVVGEPAVLGLQLVLTALFASAALAYARRAERTHDVLALWFAIGAALAAFARLNYFLFPSLYSEFFYTGDLLRLGFFVALMIGGAQEIRISQRELEKSAVFAERRRLARDMHDGMAQDLAFIVQQGTALIDRYGDREAVSDIVTAARRALDDSRGAIAALVRAPVEPLPEGLIRVAEDLAHRWGATVDAHVEEGVEVPAATREALQRIVGEAVSNAARHGQAKRIRLELMESPELRLRVVDDGVGFEPETLAQGRGRHGIAGMRERAEALGGRLHLRSAPGEGTEIVVELP